VYVTDAPADNLSHLYVTIDKVQVHQLPNRTAEKEEREADRPTKENVTGGTPAGTGRIAIDARVDDDDGSDDGHWITLSTGATTVDLKALNGSASAFIGDADVPIGNYNIIRLNVTEAKAVWMNGTEQAVKVPGHAIRIVGFFSVEQDKETRLTLDFRLDKSLIQLGNGNLLLKPVVKMMGEHRERPHDDERRERMKERDERSEREGRKLRGHD
jgi:hypothetical protein